jgi:molecular chaperone GrpE
VVDDEPADEPETPDKGGEVPRGEAPPSDEESLAAASQELSVGAGAALEFHRRARLAEDRLAEVLGAYRQLKSENEDYRDRATRNIERRYEQRRERLLLKFIDILDNLDRALDAAEKSYAGNPLIEGLILVRTQLLQTLQEEGLERIPALGLAFDPAVSESVGSQPVDDPDHHHVVVRELLRGYRLNGRIARPSRVYIGEYTGAAEEPPGPDLIGADEVAAEPVEEPVPEPSEAGTPALPLRDPEGPPIEPTLEPIPEDEGRSLEEIIAEAERRDALKEASTRPEDAVAPALAEDEATVAEPAVDDPMIREAFGVPDDKD